MIEFITLQTNSNERRKVSISYTDWAKNCHLLGNLPHNTAFTREDLVKFAKDVLDAFGEENET